MKAILTLIIIFISTSGFCQKTEKIRLPAHRHDTNLYASIKRFIPKEYKIIDQANGDLNGDGLIDKILILKLKDEITEEEKRPVLLLIRQKDHSFKKIAENDNIILSLGDGGIHGDPYHGITIKKGYFSFEHFGGSGWRWNQVITFKYNQVNQNWFLYKTGSESWHIDYPLTVKSDHQTKAELGDVAFINYKNNWRDKDND
jgi:hypothetical protein